MEQEGKKKSAFNQLILSGFHSVFRVCMFIAALGSTDEQFIYAIGFISAFLFLYAFTIQDMSKMQIIFLSTKGSWEVVLTGYKCLSLK